jgi:hypothetical protein
VYVLFETLCESVSVFDTFWGMSLRMETDVRIYRLDSSVRGIMCIQRDDMRVRLCSIVHNASISEYKML